MSWNRRVTVCYEDSGRYMAKACVDLCHQCLWGTGGFGEFGVTLGGDIRIYSTNWSSTVICISLSVHCSVSVSFLSNTTKRIWLVMVSSVGHLPECLVSLSVYGSHQCCYDSRELLLCQNWCTETTTEDHHLTLTLLLTCSTDNRCRELRPYHEKPLFSCFLLLSFVAPLVCFWCDCTAHHRLHDPSTTGSESSIYWSWDVIWNKKKNPTNPWP